MPDGSVLRSSRGVALAATCALFAALAVTGGRPSSAQRAAAAAPASAASDAEAIPTLEPAPRIEMRAYAPFHTLGTATISGNLDLPTETFGVRSFLDTPYVLMPDNAYSEYVAHLYRDAWFRNTRHPIDVGVSKFMYHGRTGKAGSGFSVSGLPAGRWLAFATVTDASARRVVPCDGTAPGFDENGVAATVPTATYCYDDFRRDELFAEGTVDVAAGERATIALRVETEVTEAAAGAPDLRGIDEPTPPPVAHAEIAPYLAKGTATIRGRIFARLPGTTLLTYGKTYVALEPALPFAAWLSDRDQRIGAGSEHTYDAGNRDFAAATHGDVSDERGYFRFTNLPALPFVVVAYPVERETRTGSDSSTELVNGVEFDPFVEGPNGTNGALEPTSQEVTTTTPYSYTCTSSGALYGIVRAVTGRETPAVLGLVASGNAGC